MKKIVFLAAGIMLAFPFVMGAQNSVVTNVGNFLAGEPCLVPIFHTDFAFPPEGGQIIRKGDQLYFVKNYLPGCGNAASGGVVISSGSRVSDTVHSTTTTGTSVVTNVGNFVAGEPCLVPVFHTDFAFPPEGGMIIRKGDQLYFWKNYIAGCENAAANGVVVSTGPTEISFPDDESFMRTSGGSITATPRFVAPKTGCDN